MTSAIMHIPAVLTMTSREIAELTGKRHDNVMADCRTLAAFYAQTYSPEKSGEWVKSRTYTDSTGRALPCFDLNKQASLDLVTGYSLAHRHAVNVRWQELEAAQAKPPAELSRMDILKLAMESEQARIEAETKLALAAPKVEFVDRYVEATGLFTFREVAKLLKANEARFREFLIENKVMYYLGKKLTAYKNHEDAGRFAVKTDTAKNGHDYRQTFFTPKGVHWVAGEWNKAKVMEAA